MKTKPSPPSLKQFKFLCHQAANLRRMDQSRFSKIGKTIEVQFNYLKRYFSRRSLVRAMASAGLILSMGQLQAQTPSFVTGVDNPFNLSAISTYSSPVFADMDGDLDLDILNGSDDDGLIYYYENTGTPIAPNFATGVVNTFGLDTIPNRSSIPFLTVGDLDGDGDLDVMRGSSEYGNFWYYENTGTVLTAGFAAPQQNPFNIDSLIEYVVPSLADMDDDGDLDMVVGDSYGNLRYYENTGTSTQPSFAAPQMNPFNWTSGNEFINLSTADVDQDGDIDVMGNAYGGWRYYQNNGTATAPIFATTFDPFNLSSTGDILSNTFGDLDNDGDLDILSARYAGTATMYYYENNPLVGFAVEEMQVNGWSVYPNPSHAQLNLKRSAELETGNYSLEIYDNQGKKIISQDLEAGFTDQVVNIESLTSGTYIARITGEGGNTRLHFVKH